MAHLPDLIQDLAVILIAAALISLLFKQLKQPVVLGYIIAGFIVGPHVPFTPSVVDTASIQIWAEIGVIFLLFGLGLEFSFKKLAAVGSGALVTGVLQIMFMLAIGFGAGQLLGWSKLDSLFLGGVLSISSTAIILRAFQELGLKARKFVPLVFGVLIVEDLVAVLLLVILSTAATSGDLAGGEMLMSTLKLAFFLILWFVLGIYFLPIFLARIRPLLNSETMLTVSIGLCLLMVVIAVQTGFSAALGAFVMGSMLAETREGAAIEKLLHPVRDLFSAIFFVSVGMLLDPAVFRDNIGLILFLSLVLILGKFVGGAMGAMISGHSLKHSIQTGMSLAQIGEFSFIIATLGLTLKVTNDLLYPLTVAVAGVTSFTTPYLIRMSDPLYEWLQPRLPENWQARLERYQVNIARSINSNIAGTLWRVYGTRLMLNSVLVFAITVATKRFVLPIVVDYFGHGEWPPVMTCLFVLIISSPFIWAISVRRKPQIEASDERTAKILKILHTVISSARRLFGVAIIGFITWYFLGAQLMAAVVFTAFVVIGRFLVRSSEIYYKRMESRFLTHLSDREVNEAEGRDNGLSRLAPWDATLSEFVLSPHSRLVAHTLQDCALKERFGVTVALIDRSGLKIIAPTRSELLLPFDRLYLIGTEENLSGAQKVIESEPDELPANDVEAYGLEPLELDSQSIFLGKSIRECGLREKVDGLIVGIERAGRRILSPDSSMILSSGDLVWVVGNKSKIRGLARQQSI